MNIMLNERAITKDHTYCMLPYMWQRRQWHPTPVLLPGKSHGWRSLVGRSPWGREESTRLSDFTFTSHFPALEKVMATHSSVLAWRIPGMEEPGRLQSMVLQRVRHDWVTSLSFFSFQCMNMYKNHPGSFAQRTDSWVISPRDFAPVAGMRPLELAHRVIIYTVGTQITL